MKNKAPGEDGITSVIYNQAFKTVPTFITAIYNGCLKRDIPNRMENGQADPNY
jgi:hypothetical protein